jgi:hypothetical protein
VDKYNPDVVIGTESWLKEDNSNDDIFKVILQFSEGIVLPLVVVFLSVLKVPLLLWNYG